MSKTASKTVKASSISARIPQSLANVLFRSFETQEYFVEQVGVIRKQNPGKPIVLALFNGGLIEFLAIKLFLFNQFGPEFELLRALGIPRFLQDLFSFQFRRTLSALGILRRERTHLAACLKDLTEGRPLFLSLKFQTAKNLLKEPASERFLASIRKYHPTAIVVPVAFVWKRAPKIADESPRDWHGKLLDLVAKPLSVPWYLLLGDPYNPRGLRKLILIARGYSKSVLRAAKTLSISEIDPHVMRRKVYQEIQHEKRLILGPIYKSTTSIQEEILRSESFQAFLTELAAEQRTSRKSLYKQSVRIFEQMAARYSYFVAEIASYILSKLFTSVYRGVDYKTAELERVREASKHGTLIFIPNHRSYFDFLLLSFILFKEHFMPPHIAAGINLNFWPIGSFLKRGGAIFIQRSFRGNPLYAEIFRRYILHIINSRTIFQFFIEGMRSRTGKMAPPRYGILKMIYEGLESGEVALPIRIVPVSITYDVVAEDRSHRRELEGGSKVQESFGGFLRAFKIFFRHYGRVHLRIAEPIEAEQWIKTKETKYGLQKLAFEICHRINQVTLLTPMGLVCTIFMAKPGNAFSLDDLEFWLNKIRGDIARLGFPLTKELETHYLNSCRRALSSLIEARVVESYHLQDGGTGLRIPGKERIHALYYKNSAQHAFVLAALRGVGGSSRVELLELRNFLEFDYFFPEKEEFLEQIKNLPPDLNYGLLAHLIDDTLESVQLGLSFLATSNSLKLDEKAWIARLMKYGQEKILEFTTRRFEAVNTQSFKAFLNLAQNEGWIVSSSKAKESLLGIGNLKQISSALERIKCYRNKISPWETLK